MGRCRPADRVMFLRAWLSNPLPVGVVAPSGKSLARLMTSELNPLSGPVLELGPGTGPFTDALIRKGVPEREIALVDLGVEFGQLLAARYPQATVLAKDATCSYRPSCANKYAIVISGLPLLSLPASAVMRILVRAFALSNHNAIFYQFTYGWRCPVPKAIFERLNLEATRIGTAISNIPPASVYKIVHDVPGEVSA